MLDETNIELAKFANSVITDARKELAAKQPKKSYRAKWSNGKLKSFTVRNRRYIPNNSKELSNSLSYEIKEIQGNTIVVFEADHYWYYVNFGRKAGKGVPPKIIDAWVRSKPVRPQKGGGAGFKKITEKTLNAMSFLINRKIKTFGIEGNMFFTKTFKIYSDELTETLGKKIAKDLLKQISKWPLA